MTTRLDKSSAKMFLHNAGLFSRVSAGQRRRLTILIVYQGTEDDPGTWMELDRLAIDTEHTVSAAAVSRWTRRPSRLVERDNTA